jgi:phospholipase C
MRPNRDFRITGPGCTSFVVSVAIFLSIAGCAVTDRGPGRASLEQIRNVVVIYAENHSFDNLYGTFPGANGISNATPEQKTQLDHDGKPLPVLTIWDRAGKPDPRFPSLPNGPFRIDAPPINLTKDKLVPSPVHAFYHNAEQINGGKNNMFAAMSQFGGWTMGYYDGSETGSNFRLWKWAKEYTLADNFFMAAFGGSYLNHQWLICACTPVHRDAPAGMRSRLDSQGRLEKKPGSPSASDGPVQVFSDADTSVTPDGYSVNTSQPWYQPSGFPPANGGSLDFSNPEGMEPYGKPVPPQTSKTIGDTLSAKGISWAWYGGGWNQALIDGRQPAIVTRTVIYVRDPGSVMFQPHHQPFNYFARFAPGTADRARHLKDGDDLMRDIERGTLPTVAFYKPPGRLTQHPSFTDLESGDTHLADLLEKLRASPQWGNMLVVLTYDENGGYWDHVPPPSGPGWSDRWGPGTRVPALLIGPMVKNGHIDSTPYDTTSIIKFITLRFNLEPLPGVRPRAGDLTNSLK